MNPGNDSDLENIDRGLGDIVSLHKTMTLDFRPETRFPDLNRTHWRTLMYIAESGPDCMKVICRKVGLEPGSFTPAADRLIEKGLLEQYQDPDDRRRNLLRLTIEGVSAERDMRELINTHFSRRLSVLDEAELIELAAALNTLRIINMKLQGIISE